MESPWQFPTDAELDGYCHLIADEMVALFGIPHAEAIGRINRDWKDRNWLGYENGLLVYHELPDHWANDIYFGRDSHWWVALKDCEQLGLGPLEPLPYP